MRIHARKFIGICLIMLNLVLNVNAVTLKELENLKQYVQPGQAAWTYHKAILDLLDKETDPEHKSYLMFLAYFGYAGAAQGNAIRAINWVKQEILLLEKKKHDEFRKDK